MADDYSGDPSSFLRAGSDAAGTYSGSTPGGQFDIVGGNLVFIGAGSSSPSAPAAGGGAKASSNFPTSVPSGNIANPVVTPVNAGTPGAAPAAQGFEMFQAMLDNVLNSEKLRQSAIDQQVNIARLAADLERVSPTRAADLAVSLGIPGLEPDLSFANSFANADTTGVFGGKVGSQNIKLPFAFSGKELSFLGNNPNVANVLSDIGDRFGRPDLLRQSAASAIPTSSSILGTF